MALIALIDYVHWQNNKGGTSGLILLSSFQYPLLWYPYGEVGSGAHCALMITLHQLFQEVVVVGSFLHAN